MDPWYPFGQVFTEVPLWQVLGGSPLEKLPPYCGTSSRWTPTCPPPLWRTCAMLLINSFSSLTNAWKNLGASSYATSVGPSRTFGGARYQICGYDGRQSAGPSTWSATLPPAYGRCASGSRRKCSWRPRRSLGRSRGTGTLYAKRLVNLPAFERLVWAHIPRGVPNQWKSIQDHVLQALKDAVKHTVADDKAPRSNSVTAALIAKQPEPVQGLLVHAYRAILRGAEVLESWHEAIIWLMPKGRPQETWMRTGS